MEISVINNKGFTSRVPTTTKTKLSEIINPTPTKAHIASISAPGVSPSRLWFQNPRGFFIDGRPALDFTPPSHLKELLVSTFGNPNSPSGYKMKQRSTSSNSIGSPPSSPSLNHLQHEPDSQLNNNNNNNNNNNETFSTQDKMSIQNNNIASLKYIEEEQNNIQSLQSNQEVHTPVPLNSLTTTTDCKNSLHTKVGDEFLLCFEGSEAIDDQEANNNEERKKKEKEEEEEEYSEKIKTTPLNFSLPRDYTNDTKSCSMDIYFDEKQQQQQQQQQQDFPSDKRKRKQTAIGDSPNFGVNKKSTLLKKGNVKQNKQQQQQQQHTKLIKKNKKSLSSKQKQTTNHSPIIETPPALSAAQAVDQFWQKLMFRFGNNGYPSSDSFAVQSLPHAAMLESMEVMLELNKGGSLSEVLILLKHALDKYDAKDLWNEFQNMITSLGASTLIPSDIDTCDVPNRNVVKRKYKKRNNNEDDDEDDDDEEDEDSDYEISTNTINNTNKNNKKKRSHSTTKNSEDNSSLSETKKRRKNSSNKKRSPSNERQRSSPNKWTKAENERLIALVEAYGDQAKNWTAIADSLGTTKTGPQCAQHWRRVLDPNIRKGSFSIVEDKKLLSAVKKYGLNCWRDVANELPGRTDIQCRYRYLSREFSSKWGKVQQ